MPFAPARAWSASTVSVQSSIAYATFRLKRSFSSTVGARFSPAIRWAARQSVLMTSRAASTFAPAPATRSCTAWKSRMRMAVARAPLPDRLERQLERGLRVADAGGREAMRAEGREGHAVQRIRVDPCAWELAAAAGQVHAESPVLGDENVYGAHRLGPGAPHAEHVPVVDDLVVAPRYEAHAVIDDAIAVADRHRQHVPVGRVDTAREVPEAADDEAAVDAEIGRASCRERV